MAPPCSQAGDGTRRCRSNSSRGCGARHASFKDGDEILSIGPSIVQVTRISDGECSDVPMEKVLEEEGSEIRVYARDDVSITPPQISTTSSSGAWEMRTNEDAVEHTVLSHLVSDSMGNIWDELQLMHCRTKDKEGSWIALDLGEGRTIEVTGYTLRHGGHYTSQLRSWELQGSATAEGPWVTIDRRKRDRTLPTYPRSRGPYVDVGMSMYGSCRPDRMRQNATPCSVVAWSCTECCVRPRREPLT